MGSLQTRLHYGVDCPVYTRRKERSTFRQRTTVSRPFELPESQRVLQHHIPKNAVQNISSSVFLYNRATRRYYSALLTEFFNRTALAGRSFISQNVMK